MSFSVSLPPTLVLPHPDTPPHAAAPVPAGPPVPRAADRPHPVAAGPERPAGPPPAAVRRVRAALVGLPPGAESVQLPALRAQRYRVELAALVDADTGRARRVRAAHGVAAAYGSLAELLAREHPDLVHLVAPADAAAVLRCLRTGAWVLAEQPPARCLAEYDRIAAAEQTGGPYAVVGGPAAAPGPCRLLRLARSGVWGRPLGARLAVPWFRPPAVEGAGRRPVSAADPVAARGVDPVAGCGAGLVELLPAVLGEWTEVRPAVARPGMRGREPAPTLLVRFTCGAVATVLPGPPAAGREPPLRLDFAEATAELRWTDDLVAEGGVGVPGGAAAFAGPVAAAPGGAGAVTGSGGGVPGGTGSPAGADVAAAAPVRVPHEPGAGGPRAAAPPRTVGPGKLTLAVTGRAPVSPGPRRADDAWQPPDLLGAVLDAMAAGRRPDAFQAARRSGLELLTGLHRAAVTGRPVRRGQLGPADPFYHHLHGIAPVPGPAPAAAAPDRRPSAGHRHRH